MKVDKKNNNSFTLMSAKELVEKYKDIPYDDRCYRRGYHHGYLQALHDVKYGKKTQKFTKFDGELMRWRYGKEGYPVNQMITPPNCEK